MSRLFTSSEESKPTSRAEKKPMSEKVGALTFHLYLQGGCPEGRETDFWQRAKEMVTARPTTDLESSIG
ncbi:MAG TPA: DUF2934 domain-containing protein [Candidatus Baltobacteraceae bacterium]|nr:DUF2934 domain-containing protein [Candidatus Baltobacteraceae bacterium]